MLYNFAVMDNNSTNIEDYINKSKEVFSRSSLSLDDINGFIKTERQIGTHAAPEFKQQYTELFTIIRDRIIYPNAGKIELVNVFEELSFIFRASKVTLQPHPQAAGMTTSFINSMSHNEIPWQYASCVWLSLYRHLIILTGKMSLSHAYLICLPQPALNL